MGAEIMMRRNRVAATVCWSHALCASKCAPQVSTSHTLCAPNCQRQDSKTHCGRPAHPGWRAHQRDAHAHNTMRTKHVHFLCALAQPHAGVTHAQDCPACACNPPLPPGSSSRAHTDRRLARRAHTTSEHSARCCQTVCESLAHCGNSDWCAHLLQRQQGLSCPPEGLRCNLVANLTHLQDTKAADEVERRLRVCATRGLA